MRKCKKQHQQQQQQRQYTEISQFTNRHIEAAKVCLPIFTDMYNEYCEYKYIMMKK